MSLSPPELETFEKRYDAVVQSGFEVNLAPAAAAAGEVKKRGRPKQPINVAWRQVQCRPTWRLSGIFLAIDLRANPYDWKD